MTLSVWLTRRTDGLTMMEPSGDTGKNKRMYIPTHYENIIIAQPHIENTITVREDKPVTTASLDWMVFTLLLTTQW